jgi:hypothetical protein
MKSFYESHGFTPVQRDIPSSSTIKQRFRTWGKAVDAAGLPWVNYPTQQRLRIAARNLAATTVAAGIETSPASPSPDAMPNETFKEHT